MQSLWNNVVVKLAIVCAYLIYFVVFLYFICLTGWLHTWFVQRPGVHVVADVVCGDAVNLYRRLPRHRYRSAKTQSTGRQIVDAANVEVDAWVKFWRVPADSHSVAEAATSRLCRLTVVQSSNVSQIGHDGYHWPIWQTSTKLRRRQV